MRKLSVLCLLLAVFSLKTNAQVICCDNLTVEQLMLESVNSTSRNDRLKQERLVYYEQSIREDLDARGGRIAIKEEARTISGARSNLAGFDISIGELLRILTIRHQFSEPTKVVLNNKSYWLVGFRPKPNLDDYTTEDKFINRIEGRIWLDAQNYSLWRVEADMPPNKEFSFRTWHSLGLVPINVRSFGLTFQQIEYMGIMVENSIQVEAKFTVLSSTRTRKYNFQYTNYRLK